MKSIINYSALKLEFYESDFLEIHSFLQHKYSTNTVNGNLRIKTKGRSKDKQKWLEKIRENAIKKAENKLEKARTPDLKKMGELHERTLALITDKLNKLSGQGDPTIPNFSMKEMKELWKIIKVEKNEPTDYIKTENPSNNDEDNGEDLTEEEKEIYNEFIKQKGRNETPKKSKK